MQNNQECLFREDSFTYEDPFGYDFSAGEDAIIQSPIFREKNLHLCSNVHLRNLFTDKNDCGWRTAREARICLDYLVCSGTYAVMVIQVMYTGMENGPMYISDLPCAQITDEDLEKGLVGGVLCQLETYLRTRFRPKWKCPLEDIPRYQQPLLVRARLAEFRGRQLLPTDLGNRVGLVTTRGPLDLPARIQCSPWTRTVLLPMLCDPAQKAASSNPSHSTTDNI